MMFGNINFEKVLEADRMEKFFALSNEKQDTIRNAALACFAKYGYEKASINDIAAAAGYDNTSYFHRIFQKRYGLTPRKYRLKEGK